MENLFRSPVVPRGSEWLEERLVYAARAREKSKFNTVLDAKALFGEGGARTTVITRVREGAPGEVVGDVDVVHTLPSLRLEERLTLVREGEGVRAGVLTRVVGEARQKTIDFAKSPFDLPPSSYPEVLLPFLMRRQPFGGDKLACYAWTSDRMVARVYYEGRKRTSLDVPAGRFAAREVWMYPDLNDWVALGSVLTKLAKPLLPRYTMWFEEAAPYRCLRFEGPYGPPGAPEVVLELAET